MSIRKILVPLSGQYDPEDPESLERPALEAGFVAGRMFDAHVEVFCIEAERSDARTHLARWIPGSAVDELLQAVNLESDKRRERVRALFEAVLSQFAPARRIRPDSRAGFSANFVEFVGEVHGSLAVRGRLADLIVTACPSPSWQGDLPFMLEVALRESGRPTLISSNGAGGTFGKRVAVAWNGSAEASRAVAMAMDFLVAAEEAIVISINEAGPFEPSAEALTEYLRWHGVGAESVTVDGTSHSAGRIILDQVGELDADMLVMGAYTRDRFRRLIFGGVTGTVLSQMPVPVLMVD